jgi:hypothetical protein
MSQILQIISIIPKKKKKIKFPPHAFCTEFIHRFLMMSEVLMMVMMVMMMKKLLANDPQEF